jgi:hypothetical protein
MSVVGTSPRTQSSMQPVTRKSTALGDGIGGRIADCGRARTCHFVLCARCCDHLGQALVSVADSIELLTKLHDNAHLAYKGALEAFQMARHHPLTAPDLCLIEKRATALADQFDWPASARARGMCPHLERPLTNYESSIITHWGNSAFAITVVLLDVGGLLDGIYGSFVATAAAAARSARSKVTADAHQKRADKLMLRLDQLCAGDRHLGAERHVLLSIARLGSACIPWSCSGIS